MTKAQTYFHRNRGEWNWICHFKLASWRALGRSDLPWVRKVLFAAFMFGQWAFGDYRLWTHVIVRDDVEIGHETRLSRFGMTLMKSVKTFRLGGDGQSWLEAEFTLAAPSLEILRSRFV